MLNKYGYVLALVGLLGLGTDQDLRAMSGAGAGAGPREETFCVSTLFESRSGEVKISEETTVGSILDFFLKGAKNDGLALGIVRKESIGSTGPEVLYCFDRSKQLKDPGTITQIQGLQSRSVYTNPLYQAYLDRLKAK